jgi:D-mannonate dehydratase
LAKFAYKNIIHSSTQQTPLFANHGLHPKFDIQGVNKVMNPTTKDQIMWLANFEPMLYQTLRKCKGNTRRMLMNIERNNPAPKLKTKFGFDNKTLRQ